MKGARCCSIIVTFNRKELLYQNVLKNLEQDVLLHILIIDNASTDGTKEYLEEKGILGKKQIDYVCMEQNMGGAGGFAYGMQIAFERGFEFVWLMDDDGYPVNIDTLSCLLHVADCIKNKKILLNSLVMCNNYRLSFGIEPGNKLYQVERALKRIGQYSIIEGSISPFNGTLISKETFDWIGNIDSELFIHGDEREYYYRAKFNDIFIATVYDSRFFHPEVSPMIVYRRGKKYHLYFDSYWKEYYNIRNSLYIGIKYDMGKQYKRQILEEAWIKLKYIKYDRRRIIFYIIKGIFDGFLGRKGQLKENKYIKKKF